MASAITVRLVGGLGNQLFCYYAGAALASHHGVGLRLDTSYLAAHISGHHSHIRDFDLPGEWLPDIRLATQLRPPLSLRSRGSNLAIRVVPGLAKAVKVFNSPVVGYTEDLLRQPTGAFLRGYFQSWQIVNLAVESGYPRRPLLRQPSKAFHALVQRAAQERPVSVHIRRGDYSSVPNFGVLGPKYYASAVQMLRGLGITGPLWIFSDEPATAARVLDGEIITGLDSPAAEMTLMSHCAAHIIANSTFSWWGAWMNEGKVPVIAPEPWFRDGPHIEGLIPPHWTRLAASYVSDS